MKESERKFGAALRAVDDSVPTYVYRPPDIPGPSSRKPCDFMAWSLARREAEMEMPHWRLVDSAWFECKELAAAVAEAFPFRIIEPSQRLGILDAKRIGIPYWLAVYWKRHRIWTISDAVRLEAVGYLNPGAAPSIQRVLLSSRFGVDSTPAQLTSTLKSILAGEVI